MRAIRRRGLDWLLNVYGGLALIYLLLPIAVIVVFSFNNPVGRFNFIWQEFSLDAWKHPFAVPGVQDALETSVEIATVSTLKDGRATRVQMYLDHAEALEAVGLSE